MTLARDALLGGEAVCDVILGDLHRYGFLKILASAFFIRQSPQIYANLLKIREN